MTNIFSKFDPPYFPSLRTVPISYLFAGNYGLFIQAIKARGSIFRNTTFLTGIRE